MNTTKEERKKEGAKARHARYVERQIAKAASAQAQESGTNIIGVSAYAPAEQIAESSTMGVSRGAIGGRFLPGFAHPFGQHSDLTAILLSQGPTDLVSGSDETMVDVAANEADPSTNPFADVTYGPQESNPIVFAPGSNGGLPYVNLGDNTFDFAPTQLNIPSIQQREYQQLRSSPPTLEELIESANADLDAHQANLNISSYPPLNMASPQFPEHPPRAGR
ncbi:hypothetical protein MMC22_007100 [Lobaria immixta]|nr:hypothetical protein [Lobaria immixta]